VGIARRQRVARLSDAFAMARWVRSARWSRAQSGDPRGPLERPFETEPLPQLLQWVAYTTEGGSRPMLDMLDADHQVEA
jgi:hypothetical protein